MPQKKISQLTSISSEAVNSTDNLELSTKDINYNNASGKISIKDIGKAIYSRFLVSDNDKTIKQEVAEAKNNNEYSQLVLVDELGGKWVIWAESEYGIRMMSENIANWYKEMDEYMAYMNASGDPHHNYLSVADNASSQTGVARMVELGNTLYAIYSDKEHSSQADWLAAKEEFDPLFKSIRFNIDEGHTWDDEYLSINTKLTGYSNRYDVTLEYFTEGSGHENDPILIIDPSEDPPTSLSFKTRFQDDYLGWIEQKRIADCNSAKTTYNTTPTQENLDAFAAAVEVAKVYLETNGDVITFMVYFECGQNYEGYNTYNAFLYNEAANPRSFDDGGPLDKQYEDMLVTLATYLNNSIDYMRVYFGDISEPEPEEKNRPITIGYITRANSLYEDIQEFINIHEEDS